MDPFPGSTTRKGERGAMVGRGATRKGTTPRTVDGGRSETEGGRKRLSRLTGDGTGREGGGNTGEDRQHRANDR